MKFIKIKNRIYSAAIIQQLSLKDNRIFFKILDGDKTLQISVRYASNEDCNNQFEELLSMLKEKNDVIELFGID